MDKYVISQNALSVLNFFELQFNKIPLSIIQIPIQILWFAKTYSSIEMWLFPVHTIVVWSIMGNLCTPQKSNHLAWLLTKRAIMCCVRDYSEACNMKCQRRPLMFIPPDGCCDTRRVFHLSAVVIRLKLSRTCDLSSFLIMMNFSHFFKLKRCLNKTCHLTSVELIFQQIVNMSVSRVIIRATAPLRCEIKY